MAMRDVWASYAPTYRASEMRTLAGWIASGASGSSWGWVAWAIQLVDGFSCKNPEALQSYLPDVSQPIVWFRSISTIYPAIIWPTCIARSCTPSTGFASGSPRHWPRSPPICISNIGRSLDPFLTQTAALRIAAGVSARAGARGAGHKSLRSLLRSEHAADGQHAAQPARPSSRRTLSYIVGMRQEVAYLPDPAILGDMYELLDSQPATWVSMTVR